MRLSAVALVFLVGHLLMMASPLHGAAMQLPGTPAAQLSMDDVVEHAGGSVAGDLPRVSGPNMGDCRIDWVSPSGGATELSGGHAPFCQPILTGEGIREGAFPDRPVPRALSPPQPADTQALLLVFRI